MIRVPVESSNLESVGYEATTELSGTIEIAFQSGGIYDYPDCPLTLYTGLMAAGSKGKFFHAHIKGRPFQKVGG